MNGKEAMAKLNQELNKKTHSELKALVIELVSSLNKAITHANKLQGLDRLGNPKKKKGVLQKLGIKPGAEA